MHQATPLFILGSERSGTNLLRRRLSEAQAVYYGPPPTHLLKHLFYAAPFYGDLADNARFTDFAHDALGLAYQHFSPWDITISVDDVLNAYPTIAGEFRTAIGMMHVMNILHARAKGFASYICKDNNLHDFAYALATHLPNARFLYIFRDPRDVVLSQRKRPTQNPSTTYLARLWRDEQLPCIQFVTDPLFRDRSHTVSYEELTTNEASTLECLTTFLGIPIEPQNASSSELFGNEATDTQEWKNLSQPTITSNTNKYEAELSTRQIRTIEALTWRPLHYLGYTPSSSSKPTRRKIELESDVLLGRFRRLCRRVVRFREQTPGQRARSAYARELREKWR